MRYTRIWEDQRLLRDTDRNFSFSLFLSFPYPVCLYVHVCEVVLRFFFFFLIIFFLHVHVKYIVVTSPTSSCSYKPQILYHCCCHVCLVQWCFLPSPPSPHYVCCCNHLIYRLWSHKNCLWWSQSQEFIMMRHDIHDGIRNHSLTNWSAARLHRLPQCLEELGCTVPSLPSPPRPSSSPALQHSFCLPHAKNQIWHKAA